MERVLRRVSLRFIGKHPWQFGLAILGIALGVAVVTAVDLTNASAQRALQLSVERIAGRATHQIIGPPSGVAEEFYVRLRREWGYSRAAPRIAGFAEIDGVDYELLGIDPFVEGAFDRSGYLPLGDASLVDLLTVPGAFLTSAANASELGIDRGDTLTARVGGIERTLRWVGTLRGEQPVGANLLLVDISTAQELLGFEGVISGIDLILTQDEARELARRLPPDYRIAASEDRAEGLNAMTRGFRLNLAALSLLALIVGGFLIYNTMTFSVVQRRHLFGLLRAVGATRRQILSLVLLEAALVGMAGTFLGLLGGLLLSQGLIQLVTRTINDLYYLMTVREFILDTGSLVKGATLGVLVALIAAALPAWEAGRASPRTAMTRSLLESQVRRALPWAGAAGLLWAAAGAVWVGRSTDMTSSYVGLFMLILGLALISPLVTLGLIAALQRALPSRGYALARLTARGIRAALSRTAAAIAALMIAIAASLGMGIMVNSFRATVEDWLAYHLQADVYISVPAHYTRRSSVPLLPGTVQRLTAHPRVTAVTTWRGVEVNSDRGPARLSVLSLDERSRRGYRLSAGSPREVWPAVEQGAVLVSESFAFRSGVSRGEALTLTTDRGAREFPVAGVYYDYGSDLGTVLLDRRVYERYWSDRAVSALGLYLDDAAVVTEVIAELRRAAGSTQSLRIRSNRELRAASLEVFDRTFTITQVLRLLAVGVAFIAVVSALMAIQLERAREFAILRASGLTPGQLWRLMLGQTLLMGGVATALALPVGLALAWVLTEVINRQSFGWSIAWRVTPADVAGVTALGVSAALLAALYPAWRIARTPPALALRDE